MQNLHNLTCWRGDHYTWHIFIYKILLWTFQKRDKISILINGCCSHWATRPAYPVENKSGILYADYIGMVNMVNKYYYCSGLLFISLATHLELSPNWQIFAEVSFLVDRKDRFCGGNTWMYDLNTFVLHTDYNVHWVLLLYSQSHSPPRTWWLPIYFR